MHEHARDRLGALWMSCAMNPIIAHKFHIEIEILYYQIDSVVMATRPAWSINIAFNSYMLTVTESVVLRSKNDDFAPCLELSCNFLQLSPPKLSQRILGHICARRRTNDVIPTSRLVCKIQGQRKSLETQVFLMTTEDRDNLNSLAIYLSESFKLINNALGLTKK